MKIGRIKLNVNKVGVQQWATVLCCWVAEKKARQ